MADPSPDDTGEGQEPAPGEGQEPDGEHEPGAHEAQGRTYSEAYVRQLRREAADNRRRLGEAEEKLQEREDADKTEQERLTERVTVAEARAQDAETRLLRYEIAAERSLDPAAVQFLSGSTREEIEHRAEELAKLLKDKPGMTTAADFDGGARRQTAPQQLPPEQAHNDFLLRALGRVPPRAS